MKYRRVSMVVEYLRYCRLRDVDQGVVVVAVHICRLTQTANSDALSVAEK